MIKQRLFNFLISLLSAYLLLITVFLFGCGYTIQTRANLPFDTISIGKIENKTREPKLEDKFHLSLAQTFAQYGFSISPSARYRLDGSILRFNLMATTEVNLTATQYQVEMLASFSLVDTETGLVIPLVANSPFITYFPATGRIEYIMAQKELGEVSAMSNLSQSLVQLIIYNTTKNIDYLFFKPEDLTDLETFTLRLREAKDPLSQYLREQLSMDLLRRVDAYTPTDYSAKDLKTALAAQLNIIIQDKEVYDKKRFASITLSDEASRLLKQNLRGFNMVGLNRRLLEEAYPDVFFKVLFKPDDIINVEGLMLQLKEAKDPISQYLHGEFPPDMLSLINTYPGSNLNQKVLKEKLANALNEIIQYRYIFDEQRFAGVMLSDEARRLITQNPQGVSSMRLNRMLLEEAYPERLSKLRQIPESRKSDK